MKKEYEIQIEVGNKCYLNCLHCSSKLMRMEEAQILTEEELANIIAVFNMPVHIYFTGGEPLANPNLIQLIKITKRWITKINTGIFTCGIQGDGMPIDMEYTANLRSAGLDDCYISLYHTDADKHDSITNRKGSYASTTQSIRNLIDSMIDVNVHLVINKQNYKELEKIIGDILEQGVRHVRLLRIVKTGAAVDNWGMIGVSYQEQEAVIMNIIKKISQYSGAVSISGFPGLMPCRPVPNALKCQAGTHLLYITNSQEIYPCACAKHDPKFLVGSISDTSKLKQYLLTQKNKVCNEYCLNPLI